MDISFKSFSRCIFSLVLALALLGVPAAGRAAESFLYQVEILKKEDVRKLTDEQLIEKYIDMAVELEASQEFHRASGFTPKEYARHKELYRYRVDLLMEFKRRKLEVPPIEP